MGDKRATHLRGCAGGGLKAPWRGLLSRASRDGVVVLRGGCSGLWRAKRLAVLGRVRIQAWACGGGVSSSFGEAAVLVIKINPGASGVRRVSSSLRAAT